MPRPVAIQLPLFQEETVDVQWAAKYLRVSEMTVLRYREEGLIKGYQMKKRGWWRLSKESVLAYERALRESMDGNS